MAEQYPSESGLHSLWHPEFLALIGVVVLSGGLRAPAASLVACICFQIRPVILKRHVAIDAKADGGSLNIITITIVALQVLLGTCELMHKLMLRQMQRHR
mmetsp:Transcript_29233/g.40759  ORF Transcript_29233/g.40759 Transcript_29233/m.40759 type:complete len:100 (+) Transcript_29233:696-995(+)